MKVAFVMIAFNSDHVLEPCLRSVLPFGQVYAAEGPVTFWRERGFTKSTDRTNDILDEYRIPTLRGSWMEKDDEQNAALSLVPNDTDFVFCLDADEIWDEMTLRSIFKTLEAGNVDSMSFKAISFYGGFDRYMTGFEAAFETHRVQRFYPGARFATHRPPTINAPDGRPWRTHHHLFAQDLRFYHYSYVFPSQMRMKAQYYASMGGNIPDYYQNVYLPWVCGNEIARDVIEREYMGVHNWLPERRGPCRTAPFDGQHPEEIQRVLPELRKRFEFELGMTNEC
jgi:glycosyltransferase involved in cell wall biosynthesis